MKNWAIMNSDLIKRADIAPLSNPIKENVHKSAYLILQKSCLKFYKIYGAVIYCMGELEL